MALGKKTGGRAKGVGNKRTAARKAEIAAGGEMPLDYMLRVMRDPSAEYARRDDMAKAAAKFCHNALASIEHTGKDGEAIKTVTEVRWTVIDSQPSGAAGVPSASGAEPL